MSCLLLPCGVCRGERGGAVMLYQWGWGEVEVGNGNVLWGVHSW